VINLLGEHHFNQIFLSELFVLDDRLFGEVGNGWRQVSSELAFGRSGPEWFLVLFKLLVEMVSVAGANPDRATAMAGGFRAARAACPGRHRPGASCCARAGRTARWRCRLMVRPAPTWRPGGTWPAMPWRRWHRE
jgi:hypothetical protein